MGCHDLTLFLSTLILGIFTFIFICIAYGKSVGMNKLIENDPDRNITSLSSFDFYDYTPEEYSPDLPNLGTTGRLYYNCYSGICTKYVEKTCEKEVCEKVGNETKCHYEKYDCSYYSDYLYHPCSSECRRNDGEFCYSCAVHSYRDSSRGKCDHESDDDYSASKSCHADNLILKWKSLSYRKTNNRRYTYINNVVSENEECRSKMKSCGFINSYKDKLCINSGDSCPINSIIKSENPPINEIEYKKVKLNDNTIFYYTNQNETNGTIVEALYADSDLLIRYDTDCEIIDTNTIKDFIEDNKIIYRGLSYDPYKIDNINNRGNSYLKWCSPLHGENVSISRIREIYQVYKYNISINLEVNKAEQYYKNVFKPCFITQIVGICLLVLTIIISILCFLNETISKNKMTALYSFFFITSIVTFVFSIVNISKLEKRIDETVYSLNKNNVYNFKVYNFINLFGNGIMILIYLCLVINCLLESCSTSLYEVITDFLASIGLFFSSLCHKKEDNIPNPVSKNEHMLPQQKTSNIEFRSMDEINGGFTYD